MLLKHRRRERITSLWTGGQGNDLARRGTCQSQSLPKRLRRYCNIIHLAGFLNLLSFRVGCYGFRNADEMLPSDLRGAPSKSRFVNHLRNCYDSETYRSLLLCVVKISFFKSSLKPVFGEVHANFQSTLNLHKGFRNLSIKKSQPLPAHKIWMLSKFDWSVFKAMQRTVKHYCPFHPVVASFLNDYSLARHICESIVQFAIQSWNLAGLLISLFWTYLDIDPLGNAAILAAILP